MPTHPRALAFKNLTRLACPLEYRLVCAPTIHPVMLLPSHARYPLSLADFMETEDSKKKKKEWKSLWSDDILSLSFFTFTSSFSLDLSLLSTYSYEAVVVEGNTSQLCPQTVLGSDSTVWLYKKVIYLNQDILICKTGKMHISRTVLENK